MGLILNPYSGRWALQGTPCGDLGLNVYGLYAQQLLGSESQNQWFKRPYASLCLLAGVEGGCRGGGWGRGECPQSRGSGMGSSQASFLPLSPPHLTQLQVLSLLLGALGRSLSLSGP